MVVFDCGVLGECGIGVEAPLCFWIFERILISELCDTMAPKMKLPSKWGKGSKAPTHKKKVVPNCKLNRNFQDRMETFGEKKMWPERGIDLDSLVNTPVPATVNDLG